MAFSTEFISELKRRCNLITIASESLKLKKSGKAYVGLCPFHADKDPSLRIDGEAGRYKCWSCGAEGDTLTWIMAIQSISFYEAVKQLAQITGLPLPTDNKNGNSVQASYLKSLVKVLRRAGDIYQHGLTRSLTVTKYLIEVRGLTPETIKSWGLGAVSRGICEFIHSEQKQLIDIGLIGLNENGSVYERLRHRITIPIFNHRGYLVGFAGRRIEMAIPLGPKFINPPDTLLFEKRRILFGYHRAQTAIRESKLAIVVEGYFDVIALHQAGEQRAIAGMGTATTVEQLQTLFNVTNKIVFCYDGDKAGLAAVRRLLPRLLSMIEDGQQCAFLFLPNGLDPDEYIRQFGLEAWNLLLQQSQSLSSLLLQYITPHLQADLDVESQVKAVLRIEKICNAITKAPYFRQIFQNEAERRYGVTISRENHEPA
ncbi:DNA primase [Yersinia aldovae]|uniref:DNA primase n=1 Tax=Yersinia aldovae TaxID=29483 RepID=UPI00119F8144|nr:DNA primase [Yersinia aldovae]